MAVAREREKEGERRRQEGSETDGKIQLLAIILVVYMNSLKRARKTSNVTLTIANRGKRMLYVYRYEISVLFCSQVSDIDCVAAEVLI